MSALRYVKAVRTRHRNSLEKEIDIATELLKQEHAEIDRIELKAQINGCVRTIKSYSDKVETQCEKYISALEENEENKTEMDTILDEDMSLCERAMDCVKLLEQMSIKVGTETTRMKEKEEKASHEEQRSFMMEQNFRQQQLIEEMVRRHQEVTDGQSGQNSRSTSVKLPKLELKSFFGDKINWPEFWDSFESTIHRNTTLSDIEKFGYLQSKLGGEAKRAISGLLMSNENYKIAIDILKERFGQIQEIIDIHYSKLMNIAQPRNNVYSLRQFLDQYDKHIRSLEVLGENTNQNLFVSMIKSKLPKKVLLHIEVQKGPDTKWSSKELRDRLRTYIVAREGLEQNDDSDEINQGATKKYHI